MLKKIDWRLSFLALALCWSAFEAGLRLAAPGFWRALPHSEPLSAALLKDRLRAFAPGQRGGHRLCVVLGDSVLYGSALREKAFPAWEQKTPPALLRAGLGPEWMVLDLSADGLQPLDMAALMAAAAPLKPEAVVLELNLRMLAPDGGKAPGSMSRSWLAAWLPDDTRQALAAAARADTEKKLFAAIENSLNGASALFRYSALTRAILFEPGMKALAAGKVHELMPGGEEMDPSDLLDFKIRPYYRGPAAAENHQGRLGLALLAAQLKALPARSFVFVTPQNLERVSGFLDKQAWDLNLRSLRDPFRKLSIPCRDFSLSLPAERFLDHCHLDPAGNQALADKILEALKP